MQLGGGTERNCVLGKWSLGILDSGKSGTWCPFGTRVWARPLKELGFVSMFTFFFFFFAALEMEPFAT